MSSTLLLILIFLCFSFFPACNSRFLGINDLNEIGPKGTVHKRKLPGSINQSKFNSHETRASPITSKKKIPEGLLRSEQHTDGATSVMGVEGDEIPKSISHIIQLQQPIKLKGIEKLEGRRRSMLVSASHGHKEEADDFKENDNVRDMVVMDYAQPHRKPPIHNKKP